MNLQDCLAGVKLLVMDFDGVLTDNHVYTFADGSEAVLCSRADGIGLQRLRKLGVHLAVITSELRRKETDSVVIDGTRVFSEFDTIADVRCRKLGIQCIHAEDKLTALKTLLNWPDHISLSRCAYIGNDVNDLECLQAVGLPIVVNDALEPFRSKAAYAGHWAPGDFLLTAYGGGYGAVREVCDLIADAIEQRKDKLGEAESTTTSCSTQISLGPPNA